VHGPTLLIVPGSPALVSELSLADAPSRRLAAAIRGAAAGDARPVDIVCDLGEDGYTARTGTFAAWGAPQVDVGGGSHLGELVVRYLLGERDYRPARDRVAPLDPKALTVVVVDGPAGLTPRAPLAFIDEAPAVHEALSEFIASGSAPEPGLDADWLGQGGVVKPELWIELAELEPRTATLLDVDATLGVGRYVGVWQW